MTLEEEIQQKAFHSEYQKAAINIMFTSGWLYNVNATKLKKFGITPEQFNVLRILRGSYPKHLMLSNITCRMIDRASNATRLVEKLRLKDLVKREVCPQSRRQVDIQITTKGLALLTEIDNDIDGIESTIKTITKVEAKELNRILDKLRK